MRRGFALSFTLLLTACAGVRTGSFACTEIGCADGLSVQVTPAAPWPPGSYRFLFEVDGEALTCTGALPLPECGTPAITCDREGIVMITESGCALPPSQHGFGDVHFPGGPETVTVEVQRDGRALARQTFTPTYHTVQPNGPGCEPICTQASEALALNVE